MRPSPITVAYNASFYACRIAEKLLFLEPYFFNQIYECWSKDINMLTRWAVERPHSFSHIFTGNFHVETARSAFVNRVH